MVKQELLGSKHYRLELSGDRGGSPRTIEFAADGPESAFCTAQRYGGGGEIRVFEDGRPLGCLRHSIRHDFWTIRPVPAAAA